MKNIIPITLLAILSFGFLSVSTAQQVISTAGDYYQDENMSLSWTIGEPVTETFEGNNLILTQGFQQPYNFYLTQILNIPAGWSGISGYIDPLNKDLENLFTDHVADLTILATMTGFYYPAANINTIGDWNHQTGYKVKAVSDFDLLLTGLKINDLTVQLPMGWSLVPVLTPCGASTNEIFGSMTNLEIIKEVAGINLYWPQFGINTLTALSPGRAYLVKMSASDSFTWPECAKSNSTPEYAAKPVFNTPWNTLHYSFASHVIAIPESVISQIAAQPGDIIGAFTPDGICAGKMQVSTQKQNTALVAFADDDMSAAKDGFATGEPLQLKIFKTATGEEMLLDVTFETGMPNTGTFQPQGMSAIKSAAISANAISENAKLKLNIYPNPSNGQFTVSMNKWPQNLQVVITDTRGNLVEVNTPGLKSGQTHWQVDLSRLSRGVYYMKFIDDQFMQVKKIIIQ